jgi:hypothetical protein
MVPWTPQALAVSVGEHGAPVHGCAPDLRGLGFRLWRAYPWHRDHHNQQRSSFVVPLGLRVCEGREA